MMSEWMFTEWPPPDPELRRIWRLPEVLAEMPTEALVEEILVRLAGREVWWCEYPEFNDPNCMTGMSLPAPGAAALPHKHSMCRWVWIVEQVEEL
jgi:hypothetical protein